MHGVNVEYCNACIRALIGANRALTGMTLGEALEKPPYGKPDTFNLDAVPEIQIRDILRDFDRNALLITEELTPPVATHWSAHNTPRTYPTVFVSDPTDRSYFLLRYLKARENTGPRHRISELLGTPEDFKYWIPIGGGPPSITGPFSAVTCIREGCVIFAVLLNYLTQEIIVACESGLKKISLRSDNSASPTLPEIIEKGSDIGFPFFNEKTAGSRYKYFVTFLGKTRYSENFEDSRIFVQEKTEGFLHHPEPGGPSRILYLSSLQETDQAIGFILSNGEKLIEWIHWLPFVTHARNNGDRALQIFEIFHPRPWTKGGVLMAPSKIYSLFQDYRGTTCLDIGYLARFPNPSKYRSTLVVTRRDNRWISSGMQRYNYRELKL